MLNAIKLINAMYSVVLLSVVMLSIVVLGAVILSIVILTVMLPKNVPQFLSISFFLGTVILG
jgi:hypothetical protein